MFLVFSKINKILLNRGLAWGWLTPKWHILLSAFQGSFVSHTGVCDSGDQVTDQKERKIRLFCKERNSLTGTYLGHQLVKIHNSLFQLSYN